MLTPSNQPEKLHSDAKPLDHSPDQPPSQSPEAEEEKGECPLCIFMKGGGCKDTFIDFENCLKEAEDKKEDVFEKCSQITVQLFQCMNKHSDYYNPMISAEKQYQEKAAIELENGGKQDSSAAAVNNNKPEAPKQDSAAVNDNQPEAPNASWFNWRWTW